MFEKKDYKEYFANLYDIELEMEREGKALLKIVEDPLAKKLLRKLISDEARHKKIVKSLQKLI